LATSCLEAGLAHAVDDAHHHPLLVGGEGATRFDGSTKSSSSGGRVAFSQITTPESNAAATTGAAHGQFYTNTNSTLECEPDTHSDDLSMLIASIDEAERIEDGEHDKVRTTAWKWQELYGPRTNSSITSSSSSSSSSNTNHHPFAVFDYEMMAASAGASAVGSDGAGAAAAVVGAKVHTPITDGACMLCGAVGSALVCLCRCGNGSFLADGVASKWVDSTLAASPHRSPSPFPFNNASPVPSVPDVVPGIAWSRPKWTAGGLPGPAVVPGSPADSAYGSNTEDEDGSFLDFDESFWSANDFGTTMALECMDVALSIEACDIFAM
jgi:hypothetical protein